MKYQRAYKTKLILNNKERSYFYGCAGFARWVYNWALDDSEALYTARLFTGNSEFRYSREEQKKHFNAVKDDLIPWNREYPYGVMESVLYEDFYRAMQRFFADRKTGYPKYKKKSARKSFRLRAVGVAEEGRINVKNKIGWLRLQEKGYIPIDHPIKSVTISEDAGDWYISAQVEIEVEDPEPINGPVLGVNFGATELAVSSDGYRAVRNPVYQKYEARLSKLNRELSRRVKFSQNWYKTKGKLSKLHRKMRNARRHQQHQITSDLVYKSGASKIVVDDFSVKDMLIGDTLINGQLIPKGRLNKAILDAGMSEMSRQTEYKSLWSGVEFEKAEKGFRSSSTCNFCGFVREDLDLGDRVWTCEGCENVVERESNAAWNLEEFTRAEAE